MTQHEPGSTDSDLLNRLRKAIGSAYEIDRCIGEGGMATVFLARDLRHGRLVAIKLLTPELGAIIGAVRFLAEIKVTAPLQHPHILGLLDSGEGDGLLWYVMPYVDGESLRQRLDRERQLAIPDAVRLATEVADALHYAHRQGIIHRDIKPENVLLRDGRAVVADFGIALAASRAGGTRLTGTGLSLGTPAYMSPEQAMGDRELDARSDQYSLAAMLYEMLAGVPPHTGPTMQAVLSALLTRPPEPIRSLRASVPDAVADALEIALAKLPADRFPTTEAFARALVDGPSSGGVRTAPQGTRTSTTSRRRRGIAFVAAAMLVGIGIGAASSYVARSAPASVLPILQFDVLADSGLQIDPFAELTPDGSTLVYRAFDGDSIALYTHRFAEGVSRRVGNAERGRKAPLSTPMISPDGLEMIYATETGLQRERLDGRNTTQIVENRTVNVFLVGGAWMPGNRLIYGISANASTGNRQFVVDLKGGGAQRWSLAGDTVSMLHSFAALPDTDRVLAVRLSGGISTIGMVSLGARTFTVIRPGLSPRYLASGHLLFGQASGAVSVQPFDLQRGDTTGPPVQVAEQVSIVMDAIVTFASAPTGMLVTTSRAAGDATLRVSRGSGGAAVLLTGPKFWEPRLSPDGRRLAVARYLTDQNFGELWLYDFATQTDQRLTQNGAAGADANDVVWSPDGRQLVYSAYDSADAYSQAQGKSLWVMPVDRSAPARLLLKEAGGDHWPACFTPDGRNVVFVLRTKSANRREIWTVPIDGGPPRPLLQTSYNVGAPRFSPDGRWITFESDETGQREVYVQPYPGPGPRLRLSTAGGRTPMFTNNGRTLVYWTHDVLEEVDLDLSKPEPILARRRRATVSFPTFTESPQYDFTADGSTFVAVQMPPSSNRFVVSTRLMVAVPTAR